MHLHYVPTDTPPDPRTEARGPAPAHAPDADPPSRRRTFAPPPCLSGVRPEGLPSGKTPLSVEVSDLALVERVQKGDRASFDVLVLKYQHRVLKLIMRYTRDPAEAEDIAQEAFVKAYRALSGFRGDSAFYTWLYRIATNTAKNALVARKRRPVDYDFDMNDPEQHDVQSRLQHGDTPEALVLSDGRAAGRAARRHRDARDRRPVLRGHRGGDGVSGRHGPVADFPCPGSDRRAAATADRRWPGACR